MQKARLIGDVDEMTDSLMMDVFRRAILGGKVNLEALKGTWEEASYLLLLHFGKLSRVMVENQGTLHRLYLDCIVGLRET